MTTAATTCDATEDLSSMGVRLRLYGCERMRRERMIGECIVSFSSLPAALDYPLEQWLTLEPRSNITVRTSPTHDTSALQWKLLRVSAVSQGRGQEGERWGVKTPPQLKSNAVFHISLHFRILNMIATSNSSSCSNKTCGGVLHRLYGHAMQQRVAVVKAACNECLD